MMRYEGQVIRPPSEAMSYILQVTLGCSANTCTFCPTYSGKRFRVRPEAEVFEDISMAGKMMPDTSRVFLADGNALVLGQRCLLAILARLNEAFAGLTRVSLYANARDIHAKSDEQLNELVQNRVKLVYLGLESGSDTVLTRVEKHTTAREQISAIQKAKKCGLKTSVIALLGLGGEEDWEEHAIETGKAVSQMDPDYFSLLALMVVPGTKLHQQQERGEFKVPAAGAMLQEMKLVLENIRGVTSCVFRTNHASNYLPLKGVLPQDRDILIAAVTQALARGEEALKPEYLRGL